MLHVCRLFGISRQSIYQREKRSLKRYHELCKVKELVIHERIDLPRLGTRKLLFNLHDAFLSHDIKIGRDGLFEYLRHQHMLIKPLRSYHKTTQSKHWLRKHPNLIQEYRPEKPEQLWVADITYIETKEQVAYLSLITDAYSRKIVGYHLHDSLHTDGVIQAYQKALKNRKYDHPLIHHSDRGLQYCSSAYQSLHTKSKVICSMTDGYDCYQNALAERINGILKHEFLIVKPINFLQAKIMIDNAVKMYNGKRPHLALNYQTPNQVHKQIVLANIN
jgi:putative transposase